MLTGGEPCTDGAGKGRFFRPTLVADATHDMSIMVDESFGPVVAVASVDSGAAYNSTAYRTVYRL